MCKALISRDVPLRHSYNLLGTAILLLQRIMQRFNLNTGLSLDDFTHYVILPGRRKLRTTYLNSAVCRIDRKSLFKRA